MAVQAVGALDVADFVADDEAEFVRCELFDQAAVEDDAGAALAGGVGVEDGLVVM